MISRLTPGLRCLLPTLHERRCRRPCKARFRLAGCAFAGRELNPLDRSERFQATSILLPRTSPDASWAHCRRGFFDEWEHRKSAVAKEALDRIAAIYAIEAKAAFAPATERMAHRMATAPLLDAFFAWAEATVTRLSAKSALAAAFRYAINRREALTRFVTDGRLEADNNIAENAMRAIALGRKNYLFAGSDTGGDRAAAIYTIIQTAKLNGVSPEAYLKNTLTKIAEGHPINRIVELMPWRIASLDAAQPE